ncbi:MarR family winged helix-turn-helix transcriptional regulator [Bordetella bronchialis]|uniref:MarR family transcriptional regulator n=1 Tax=Bordetella bronchialis TaxID=463025 RepID=A0A193FYJ3_9BORD|nr:MarR family transcriptional regulator [Bordetella bronchialis]ANN72827.1 MarR family transcriptional regulator [Bordetella bronchialis]
MNTEPIATSEDSPPYRCDRTRVEENPGYLIRLVFNSLNRALDQEMAPLGLTATQWRPVAMVALGRADTAAELARLNEVDTGAMTRTLDRLEAKKLLRRKRSEQDRRVVKIELTEEGQAMVREIPANIARTVNHYLRGFSEKEVELLTHFLRRMLANGSAPVPPAKA